ncbi:MAG: prepilin-type N-terminal cleavage/methylation domain-containing protein [Verrucomicrobiaceae bacterium]|nr:MAG: prepilin-type N-terminal cleavage/methylation domain-containing protein [Verrucomicrobiaceae bacterium]
MKLTNTQNVKSKSGMTLLELTVVILVLLSLISILFIGARAWKKGSDRAANILNVRNVQQAVRAHANVRGLDTPDDVGDGVALPVAQIIGTGLYLNAVKPPLASVEEYEYTETVPAVGEIYISNAALTAIDGEYFYSADELAAKTGDW